VAELLRIKGELLLKDAGDRSTPTAEDGFRFREALEVAREQRAMFWELRLPQVWRGFGEIRNGLWKRASCWRKFALSSPKDSARLT
jgi:hypothetical protein